MPKASSVVIKNDGIATPAELKSSRWLKHCLSFHLISMMMKKPFVASSTLSFPKEKCFTDLLVVILLYISPHDNADS